MVRVVFTGVTRRLWRQTLAGLGLVGALALARARHRLGWPRMGWSASAWPTVGQQDTEPQESQDRELVVNIVRHHGNAPLHDGGMGAF